MKFAPIALAALASLVSAETFNVDVGLNAEGTPAPRFNPPTLKAKVGDQVAFIFRAKNHTVTQSSFAEPCIRQFNTATQQLGVTSPFIATPEDPTQFQVWTIEIQDDSGPLWFYCDFGGHCNGGMVFSINPQDPGAGDRTHEAFAAKAATATHFPPEESRTADFTPPAQTGAPAPGNNDPSAPAPTGELSVTTPGAEQPAPDASSTGTNTAVDANISDPAAPGSPAFAVKASSAGIAASFVALVAALAF